MFDSYVVRQLPEPAHSLMGRVRALYLHGSMDWLAAVERMRDEYNIHQNHVAGWNIRLSMAAHKHHDMNIWTVEKKLDRRHIAHLMTIVIEQLKTKKEPPP